MEVDKKEIIQRCNIKFSDSLQKILDTGLAVVTYRMLKEDGLITGQELKKVEEDAEKMIPDSFEDHGEDKVCY